MQREKVSMFPYIVIIRLKREKEEEEQKKKKKVKKTNPKIQNKNCSPKRKAKTVVGKLYITSQK